MRSRLQRTVHAEEEESAFVSMTDMTVSFLFIVMIMLAFFASQLKAKDTVTLETHIAVKNERDEALRKRDAIAKELNIVRQELASSKHRIVILERKIEDKDALIAKLEEQLKRQENREIELYLSKAAEQRRRILETLQAGLKADFPEFQEIFSIEGDALRFKGDGLFATGKHDILAMKKRVIQSLATHLSKILPCYSWGSRSHWNKKCNDDFALIEAIQIEGHTDSKGDDFTNMPLSTNRANSTFFTMLQKEPTLVEYKNAKAQPILSVAGYGSMRPTNDNKDEKEREANRRIDLRIIMYTPTSPQDIDKVKESFKNNALREGEK